MKRFFFLLVLGLAFSSALPHSGFAIGENNPTGATGDWNGSVTTGGSYDPYTGNAKRAVDDLVVTGSIGAYPLKWSRVWNSRGGGGAFGNSNWWHNYMWGMWTKVPVGGYIDGEYEGPEGEITYPDGRRVQLQKWSQNVWVLLGGAEPMDRLVYMGNYNYDLVMRDGGRVRFIASGPPNANGVTGFNPAAIIDPYGQTTTIGYDSLGRFSRVTEPGGRYLQINYARLYALTCPSGQSCYADVISSVQAFASPGNLIETVTYHYTQELAPGVFYSTFNYLTSVDYDDGGHAYYTYNPAGQSNPGNPWSVVAGSMKSCDDVRYAGAMKRIRYEYMAVSTARPEIAWGQLKAEKNWAGQTISEIEYPVYDPYQQSDPGWRVEHRPDGATRRFQYSGCELSSSTDFLNHSSSIAYGPAPAPNQWVNYVQTFTDARGNVTTSEKEQEAGQVIRRTNPDGSLQTFAYEYVDGAPYYLQIRGDELGRNTYYTRDAGHRVIKIWYGYDPGNVNAFPTEEFTYNNFSQVLTHKLTTGGSEYFEYDNTTGPATRGLKTKHTDPLGSITRYEYYQTSSNTDRLYRVVDPRGNSTWYEYNQRGQVTKVTHQDGSYAPSGYNGDGTLAWSADELGHTTSYTYDEYKRLLTVSNALNETTTNYYGLDWTNLLLQTTNTPKYTLSPMGKNVVYEYDANRRKTYQGVALGTGDAAATTFEYDAVGNVTKTTDPRGNVATFGYDNRNRQVTATNALNQTATIQFDGVGNKIKETRPDSAFRSWEYEQVNPMNRLVKTVDWRMSTSEPQVATQYWRNVPSTTETITDAKGAVYTFGYDLLHRKTVETYPADAGGVVRTDKFWYDIAGNLILTQNPAGQYKGFEYDNRNREITTWWDNWWIWPSDAGPLIRKTYDAASRLTSVTTNNGDTTVAFGYDAANRQVWEDQTLSGYPTRRVLTPRDNDGNRSALQVAGSYLISHDYTQRGQLAHIFDGNNNPFCNFTYDASGNMTNREMRWIYPNGANFAYDALNRVTQVEQGNAWQVFTRHHYQYDSVGREVATWREEDSLLGSGRGERFEYTPTNQLKKAWYQAQSVTTTAPQNASKLQEYNYTPDMLNRSSVVNNGIVEGYAANGLNQYTGVGGLNPSYNDGNFNLTGFNGATYVYGYTSQLISANKGGNSVQFTYDGLGRCVRRVVNGAARIFTYDGWKPILEWDGAGNWLAMNFYGAGPDEILARYDSIGRVLIYKHDKQGNVVALLDSAGNVVEKYSYDAFGQPTVTDYWGNVRAGSIHENRFMFTGREWIKELGIYDYRNRFYYPGLGRFLQSDPTGFDAGDMNLFRYCGEGPVDRSDPLGLIDSNNFDPNTPDYTWAQRADLSMYSHLFSYGAHGGDHDYNYGQALNPAYRSTGQTIPLNTVIASIKGNPIFQHRSGTLLIVCNSGTDRSTFARSVAMGTGKDVLAPNKYLWLLNQKGHPFVVAGGYRDRSGHLIMNTKDPGRLDRFYPDGSSKPAVNFKLSARDANGAIPVGGPGVDSRSSTPTAAQVDAAPQATGVPSQAAEAVNHVRAYNL
jgi:RHS repeat-associated protein